MLNLLKIFQDLFQNYTKHKQINAVNFLVKISIYWRSHASKGVHRGRLGGSNPPIGLSTKMHNKENTTFLALLSLFFLCNDMDSNIIWSNFWNI